MSRVRQLLARRDGVAQLAVVLGAFGAYEAARHAMEPNWAQAFANANAILSVEEVVLTIVVTGNHVLLDAVAGMLVLAAGFLAARWWHARRHADDRRVCTA